MGKYSLFPVFIVLSVNCLTFDGFLSVKMRVSNPNTHLPLAGELNHLKIALIQNAEFIPRGPSV